MCAIEDGERFSFLHTQDKRAAKEHQCIECHRTIRVGETYRYAFGVYDGRGEGFHTCAHCWAAAQWLMIACSGYLFYGMLEDLEEHWTEEWELRSITLARLIVGVRRKWFEGRLPIPDVAVIRESIPSLARAA